MKFDEAELRKKGFVQNSEGEWHKPATSVLDRLEAREHSEQKRALDKGGKAKQSRSQSRSKSNRRKRPAQLIVTMTAHVQQYFDTDNLGIALKPVRDAIANWLVIDDGDYIIAWEHDQTLTRGTPGVCVVIQDA